MDEGGGMYAHEHAYHSMRTWWQRMFSPAPQEASEAAAVLPSAAAPVPGHISSATVKEDGSQPVPETAKEDVEDVEGKDHTELAKVKPPAPWSAGS